MKLKQQPVMKESKKTSALTNEDRRHLEESLQHNDTLMKKLAQM